MRLMIFLVVGVFAWGLFGISHDALSKSTVTSVQKIEANLIATPAQTLKQKQDSKNQAQSTSSTCLSSVKSGGIVDVDHAYEEQTDSGLTPVASLEGDEYMVARVDIKGCVYGYFANAPLIRQAMNPWPPTVISFDQGRQVVKSRVTPENYKCAAWFKKEVSEQSIVVHSDNDQICEQFFHAGYNRYPILVNGVADGTHTLSFETDNGGNLIWRKEYNGKEFGKETGPYLPVGATEVINYFSK